VESPAGDGGTFFCFEDVGEWNVDLKETAKDGKEGFHFFETFFLVSASRFFRTKFGKIVGLFEMWLAGRTRL